jgi:hypothetical protein
MHYSPYFSFRLAVNKGEGSLVPVNGGTACEIEGPCHSSGG